MTRPVFFSMGGIQDAGFAASVKNLLPDLMAYFYKRTGEEGVGFRTEIEGEIQNCRLFVVFWSEEYLKSEHACWELATVRRLIESQGHSEKDILIVPIGEKIPDFQGKWKNPLNAKDDEFILGKWRLERALDPSPDAPKVAEHIRRKLSKAQLMDQVLVPRSHVLEAIKLAVALPDYQTKEFVFISGYEGDGRRTALRQYMKSSYGNLTERQVAFDSAEGPEDLLPRMLDAAGASTTKRGEVMKSVTAGSSTAVKELRKLCHEARTSKSYYVVTMNRFSGVDLAGIPYWVSDVFSQFGSGNAPLIFFITANPVTDALLKYYPKAGRVRVNGLDEHEIAELVHRLSLEDTNPRRWTEAHKQQVCTASGSSPSLCKIIMNCMAAEPTLDFLNTIVQREEESFSAHMSSLLAHLIGQFKNRPNDILALRIIERLGLTSKQALDEIIEPLCQNGSYDLYQLREYGLVEQLSDDVYRIPPLLQRRLGYLLWGATRHKQLDELFEKFGKKMMVANDQYGSIYASNKVVTNLRAGGVEIPDLDDYLTTATLFKVGWERYTNGRYVQAYSVLKRTMVRLRQNSTVDLTTQIEIARYSGLSAARSCMAEGVQSACNFLEINLANTPRAQQAKAMAAFLRGFRARMAYDFKSAVSELENARWLLKDVRGAERQRGAILTELSAAYLRRKPPNYQKAFEAANQAYREKDVVHTRNGLIRALIFRAFYDEAFSNPNVFKAEISDIESQIASLGIICKRTGQDFHITRRADLEREHTMLHYRETQSGVACRDFTKAIGLMTNAFVQNPRFQNQIEIWKLQLHDQSRDYSQELIADTKNIFENPTQFDPAHVEQAIKFCVLATSRSEKQTALRLLNQHRNNLSSTTWTYLNDSIGLQNSLESSESMFLEFDPALS